MVTYSILGKGLVRQLIETVVSFHPDMSEKQRQESVPACLTILALLTSLITTYVGFITWLIA
ncbi:hypothetical protein GCM10027085_23500 [Spirosoma aerophilum]